jgi:hypothetical protein
MFLPGTYQTAAKCYHTGLPNLCWGAFFQSTWKATLDRRFAFIGHTPSVEVIVTKTGA